MNTSHDTGPSTVPGHWSSSVHSQRDTEPGAARRAPAPHPERKPQTPALTTQAHVWLARLRPDRQPMATARRHPHVVNRLAELWSRPDELLPYLHELMLGSRPEERQGFAFEVLAELADLQALAEETQQRG